MHPYFSVVGPFFDDAGALPQLDVDEQTLEQRRSAQTVLAMQTGDGTWLYPAWQFTGRGDVRPELVPVLAALRGLDRWAAGVWLNSAHPDLDGQTPRAALRDGVDPRVVAACAYRDTRTLTT